MKHYEKIVCRDIIQMRPEKDTTKKGIVFKYEPTGRGWLTLSIGRIYSPEFSGKDKDRPLGLYFMSEHYMGSTPIGGITAAEPLWHVRVDDLKAAFPKRKKNETTLAWAQRSAKAIKRKFPFKFTQEVSESIPRESFLTASESLESGLVDWVVYAVTKAK